MLVLDGQERDLVQDARDRHGCGADKGLVVDVGKQAHEELAVEPVRDAAVSGDEVTKVLLFVGK